MITLAPISEGDLAELWFSLRNKTWRAVAAAVKACGVDQKVLAERIGMDPGQFNKAITGKKSNVTLRTLHNIARAANHRLRITLEPLADLPKPNYSYEAQGLDWPGQLLKRETRNKSEDNWSLSAGTTGVRQPETLEG